MGKTDFDIFEEFEDPRPPVKSDSEPLCLVDLSRRRQSCPSLSDSLLDESPKSKSNEKISKYQVVTQILEALPNYVPVISDSSSSSA